MNIFLQPELEQYLQQKVREGQYQSFDEAVGEGIRLLMNRDEDYQERFEELKTEIRVGVEASERGEVIDSEVVFERLQQKLNQHRISNDE
ncbi:MAG: type II toxin-antitoxin system ParD family antitoxin [Jaaginema sp. PMC 1079.18]|nr:type II toxin-antitoxin system ParD family antitoxin [Jaaginema sp. PMC 1080.18]MEC4853611.1 type II toxin-antitoxin system ParD family antitoxin [Jaaginema sp. PMC 1079.18]MEC4868151.1 type II toxin-antitoxin system ParD family antitoxin [Jaaginema sp. PMC 1078.18]